MINRYAGEIRINPVAVLRNDDFNNEGFIEDIHSVFDETLKINQATSERITRLKAYLRSLPASRKVSFNFADGGYIAMKGLTDEELLAMKSKGLIDLFDFAVDREWVKKYGAQFGLVWENGRAVEISDFKF